MAGATGKTALRLLIVEEEKGITDLFVDLMSEMGYEVETAEDGEEALGMIPSYKPHMVVSDIFMPKIDGDKLYSLVIKKSPEYADRFIFITGNQIDDKLGEFLAETGCPMITKPFDILELSSIIQGKIGKPK